MHIASFSGNMGDILNHKGFYKFFRKYVCDDFSVEEVEIRYFYKNCKKFTFDDSFLNYINSFDLLILGGGGFFTVEWDYSDTSTTIDMSKSFIDGINIPVIVNAMGYHECTDRSDLFIRFKTFIQYIASKKNWLITLRNDGSGKRLVSRYGHISGIEVVPDNALLLWDRKNIVYTNKPKTIGILFSDSYRYNQVAGMSLNDIIEKIQNVMQKLLKDNKQIVLFSHIPQDYFLINMILDKIEPIYLRTNVIIAGYDAIDENSLERISQYYKMCNCIVSTRLHGNIFSLTQNIATIGLVRSENVEGLFEEIGLSDRVVLLNSNNFDSILLDMIYTTLEEEDKIVKRQNEKLEELHNNAKLYFHNIKSHINSTE